MNTQSMYSTSCLTIKQENHISIQYTYVVFWSTVRSKQSGTKIKCWHIVYHRSWYIKPSDNIAMQFCWCCKVIFTDSLSMVALRHLTKIQCRESTSITLPRRKDMLFYVSWSKYNGERVGKYYFTTSTKLHTLSPLYFDQLT
jgi:hypothetical protein